MKIKKAIYLKGVMFENRVKIFSSWNSFRIKISVTYNYKYLNYNYKRIWWKCFFQYIGLKLRLTNRKSFIIVKINKN